MKVLISWSGERSQKIANALREWLPNVIQAIQPWMSASDIDKGARWSSDIASELEESVMGIICLTPENLEAPWILFEAGAISKTIDGSFVCPYLFQVEPSDISGPLVQFQSTKANKDDTKNLIKTINEALGKSALPEQNLSVTFEKWWPEFERKLNEIPEIQMKRDRRTDRQILEEVLDLVRKQTRGIAHPKSRISQKRLDFVSSDLFSPVASVALSPAKDIIKNIIKDLGGDGLASVNEIIKCASEVGIDQYATVKVLIAMGYLGDAHEAQPKLIMKPF